MTKRIIIGSVCAIGLLFVFLFQRIDLGSMAGIKSPINIFLFNRTARFLFNDALTIGLIFALFPERKYVIFSIYVQIAGVILFLLPYFVLKLYYPSYNGPMISFLHRLILNPTLLMLLIPAFYYQRRGENKPQRPL
ncbi:MAG: exosortase F system-associated protein [Chryseolinea sp.]